MRELMEMIKELEERAKLHLKVKGEYVPSVEELKGWMKE